MRVQIPKHLWAAAGGKREYIKPLKTRDLNEANRLKHAYVAAFKGQIAALERHKPVALDPLIEKALAFRDALERHKGDVLVEGRDGEPLWSGADEFLGQVSDEAKELLETHGETVATTFYKTARGAPLLDVYVEPWLTEQGNKITEQTRAQHRGVVKAFLVWAGQGALIEEVTRRQAGEFVSHLLAPTSGLSRKTVQRYVSSLSALWLWFVAKGLAPDNPWRGHGVGRQSKRGEAPKRGQWTDAALVKVLSGHYTQALRDHTP